MSDSRCYRRIGCMIDVQHTHELLDGPPWYGPAKIHVPLWMEREIRAVLAAPTHTGGQGAASED